MSEKVMAGLTYPANARVMQMAPDLNKVVAQVPGALAYMSEKNAAADVKIVRPETPIIVPFSLVTVGEPAEAIKGAIADIQTKLK